MPLNVEEMSDLKTAHQAVVSAGLAKAEAERIYFYNENQWKAVLCKLQDPQAKS